MALGGRSVRRALARVWADYHVQVLATTKTDRRRHGASHRAHRSRVRDRRERISSARSSSGRTARRTSCRRYATLARRRRASRTSTASTSAAIAASDDQRDRRCPVPLGPVCAARRPRLPPRRRASTPRPARRRRGRRRSCRSGSSTSTAYSRVDRVALPVEAEAVRHHDQQPLLVDELRAPRRGSARTCAACRQSDGDRAEVVARSRSPRRGSGSRRGSSRLDERDELPLLRLRDLRRRTGRRPSA